MQSWGKRADMLVHGQDPYNAEPPVTALAGHPRTEVDTFYSRNHGAIPDLDPDTWRLSVEGLVDHRLELSLDQLRTRFAEHDLPATLQCAGNRRAGLIAVRDIPGEAPWRGGATSTALWTGVRLSDVLGAAGLRPDAAHVWLDAPDVSHTPDPPQAYSVSIPVAKATRDEVLLAWGMNGSPLPRLHGAPLRVVVPGWIGARSVKWLQRITAAAEPSPGHYQATAYRLLPPQANPKTATDADGPQLGPVAANCEIFSVLDGDLVSAGATTLAGYAFAGDDRSVVRVDVSADGGTTWQQAVLDPPDGPWTWQQWRADVRLAAGPAELVARAWDSTGALQPEHAADLWNPKGYVNNCWARVHVSVR